VRHGYDGLHLSNAGGLPRANIWDFNCKSCVATSKDSSKPPEGFDHDGRRTWTQQSKRWLRLAPHGRWDLEDHWQSKPQSCARLVTVILPAQFSGRKACSSMHGGSRPVTYRNVLVSTQDKDMSEAIPGPGRESDSRHGNSCPIRPCSRDAGDRQQKERRAP
jgi:hypothetical protein